MITFPNDLTPVPDFPGYFWDVTEHKLYSIKVGGVLRELKVQRMWASVYHYGGGRRFSKLKVGQLYYNLSHKGIGHPTAVGDLKKLKLTDYAIPQIKRMEIQTA
jgi:hypothetical protein